MVSLLMGLCVCCVLGIALSEHYAAAEAAESELCAKVGRFRAWRTGMNFRNVRRHMRDLIDSGDITPDMTHEQMANIVMDAIRAENPRAFNDVPKRDWQAFFDFIMKLLPIILAIFGM